MTDDVLSFTVKVDREPGRHRLLLKAWTENEFREHLKKCQACKDDVLNDLRSFMQMIDAGEYETVGGVPWSK